MNVTETHYVEGTPFVTIKTDEEKFMIALGNQLVSELEFDNLEDVKEYCNEKGWDLLTSVMLILANHLYTTKELEKSYNEDELNKFISKDQEQTEKVLKLLED